jgi:uncharacterized spore protein YtfJ
MVDVMKTIEQARDSMSVKRVYGDPFEKEGVTVIPAARVQGGAGGGGGEGAEGEGRGSGTGFGVNAKPAGAFVIRGDDVSWRPAIDVNRAILGGQIVALGAILLVRSIARARARRSLMGAMPPRFGAQMVPPWLMGAMPPWMTGSVPPWLAGQMPPRYGGPAARFGGPMSPGFARGPRPPFGPRMRRRRPF